MPESRLYQHCFAAAIDEVSLLTRTHTVVPTTDIDMQAARNTMTRQTGSDETEITKRKRAYTLLRKPFFLR
jgi:hypothetical protein